MKKLYPFVFICFLSGTIFSQTVPPSTIGQIYNFDVGDTFEYEIDIYNLGGQHGCNSQGWEMRIVISKEESAGSITYNYRRNSIYSWNCNYEYGGSGSGSDTAQLTATQLDSTIFWYHRYQAFGCDTNGYCYSDTFYVDSAMDNLKINDHSEGAWNFGADTAYADGVGLLGEGFGSEDYELQQGGEDLIYYHKVNGEQWGNLVTFLITGVHDIGNQLSTQIFPNPASSSFQLRLSGSPPQSTYFQLYDALGRQVRSERITETNTTIERNDLTNGIYFWQLEADGQILNRGKTVFE